MPAPAPAWRRLRVTFVAGGLGSAGVRIVRGRRIRRRMPRRGIEFLLELPHGRRQGLGVGGRQASGQDIRDISAAPTGGLSDTGATQSPGSAGRDDNPAAVSGRFRSTAPLRGAAALKPRQAQPIHASGFCGLSRSASLKLFSAALGSRARNCVVPSLTKPSAALGRRKV